MSTFYQGQCSAMLEAAEAELGGVAEWAPPVGGMFLWIRALGVPDTAALISKGALQAQVVLAPGNAFFADSDKPSPWLRASYSNVTPEQMRQVRESTNGHIDKVWSEMQGMKRLGDLLRAAGK